MRLVFAVLLFVVGCGGGSGQETVTPAEVPIMQEEMTEPEETEDDCYSTDQETLIEFMEDVIDEPVVRWTHSPTLRIAEGHSSQERRILEESVENINSALPDEYDIVIGSDAPARSGIVPE